MRSVEEGVRSESATRVGLPRPWAWAGATIGLGFAGVWLYRHPEWITEALDVATAVDGNAPPTVKELLVVLVGILILMILCVRRFLFARAVRRPGAIEVLPFVDGTEESPAFEAATATFHKTLAGLSLAAPTPLPGTSQAQGFLQSVLAEGKEAKGVVGMIAGLLGTLAVDCGYRVTVTARVAPAVPRYGLDVSILSLPAGPTETRTVWADSWCNAARQAADVVGAYVLARTALCNKGPWPHWRGVRIEPQLFGFYQRAQACMRKQRYEEALGFCYQALELDPLNAPIRILACQLQEKLGLYLSAVSGYADVIATESGGLSRRSRLRIERDFTSFGITSSRRRRRRPPGPRRHSRESLLIARYRFVCALANADAAMDRDVQAREGRDNSIRRTELARLEKSLHRWSDSYRRRLEPALTGKSPGTTLARQGDQQSLFRLIAWCEANELYRDYAWRRGQRRPRMPVSQGALRLLRVWTLAHMDRSELPDLPELSGYRDRIGWPRDGSLEGAVTIVRRELGRTPERWRRFQEYYNAAAILGVALRVRSDDHGATGHAEQVAVAYLERAVESAPRAMVWQYSRWFAAEDQSLKVLRGSLHYVDFLERHFPGIERREERPENVLQYLFSTHVLTMAGSYARICAEASRTRHDADDHLTRRAELKAVRTMTNYCRDYRDWRTRLALIKAGADDHDEAVPLVLERSFPRFQDEPGIRSIDRSDELNVDRYYQSLINRRLNPGIWPDVHNALAALATRLEQQGGEVGVGMCSMWGQLADLMEASLDDRDPHSPTTSNRCARALHNFQGAALQVVRDAPPKGRAAVLAHLPVRLGHR